LGGTVDYFTALGDDCYSDFMLSEWGKEGVGSELVYRLPGAMPGLYIIQTDDEGERQFHYWRDQSAAKQLFNEFKPVLWAKLLNYNYLYLSGISLSLMSSAALVSLWLFLAEYRQRGGKVVFDLNYRPRGWASADRARATISQMISLTDIALPSFEDEQALFNDQSISHCIQRYQAAGVQEIVLKNGAAGCTLVDGDQISHIPVTTLVQAIDTTAAGDSFNGGYLAARLNDKTPQQSVFLGQACAALVIQYPGAIVAKQHFDLQGLC
jgi:2-dehydro-3-deoxygluconokinase